MTAVVLGNSAVALAVAGAVFLAVRGSRGARARSAWRELRANRIAMVSLAVLSAYVAIGLLDSVAWRDRAADPAGAPLSDPAGKPIHETRARSVLDRMLTPLTERREKTYSAPLAGRLLMKETVVDPGTGRKTRGRPPLRHPRTHLLGTDKVGMDVLYLSLKGVRTALLIGGVTTLLVIPLAILFGVTAGYFGRWVDDVVQYLYTTLSSIPGILLIISLMMLFQRSVLSICVILAVTGWMGLCRLVRAETMKIRELEYVQAARALGAGHAAIILRHVVPNLMHIVLISSVLMFSGLVLTEVMLSYLGIGVDPGTGSWGHMINAARQELSREPAVWWNLAAAFAFMFGLVLSANAFGDALRDALDPRLRTR